jgi:hypothetical protein
LIASSRSLEASNPKLSLQLNPFNVDAFIALSQDTLGEPATSAALDQLLAAVGRMLAQAPGDARLYSVRGAVQWQRLNTPGALSAFQHALVLAPTELYALQWMIRHSVEQDDKATVVNLIDVLFRRWPDRIPVYAGLLPEIFQRPDERRLLVRGLERRPPWRTTALSRMSRSPGGALFAADLLWDLAQGQSGQSSSEINQVLGALLEEGRYNEAYQTFLVTLSSERQLLGGNVYNGRFSAVPSGAPFDWLVKRQPGLTLSMPETDDEISSPGLSLEFLQTPVKDPGIRQYLNLPPGRYRLSLQASAHGAVFPKELFWTVNCFKPGALLATLPVSQGTYPRTEFSSDLLIPESHCGLQVLRLGTRAMTGSWNDRYSGRVHFDDIRIVSKQ